MYCAEKSGKFMPGDGAARAAMLEALMVASTDVTPIFGACFGLMRSKEPHAPSVQVFKDRLRAFFKVWDDKLAKRKYAAGDEVTIANESYPDAVRGRIAYIAPALDPATRTLQARIQAANPGERLKKDMYVTAEVRAGVIPDAMTVPDAGVLRDTENMPYVYLRTGTNQFARRMVTLGDSQSGATQVLTGLQTGDTIVGDGSLFLQFQNSLQR